MDPPTPTASGAVLSAHDLAHRFPGADFELHISRLTVQPGERLAITGPSGSGKTTLLNLLTGILAPIRGSIEVLGFRLEGLPEVERRDLRLLRMGLVFQEFELLEHLDALDNVLLPYRLSPYLTLDGAVRDRARALLRQVGLGEMSGRHPSHLSQGERQRVAVARALVTRPALTFADEPTGNLDAENRERIADLLFGYSRESGAPLIMATHDGALLDRFHRAFDLGRGA